MLVTVDGYPVGWGKRATGLLKSHLSEGTASPMKGRTGECVTDGLVLIRGAGDLASGVAARLHRSGFPVVMTELAQPLMVRRAVCFGEAVYAGEVRVEEITARLAPDAETALALAGAGVIPVLIDPAGRSRAAVVAARPR